MLNLLRSGDFKMILIYIIAGGWALSIHEMAHALASYWLGDATAKYRGRISLNPFHHIDWTGFACLLLFGFGWAQPVPINPYEYKNPKLGTAWSAFAGPLANFVLAFLCIFCFDLLAIFSRSFVMTSFGSFSWLTIDLGGGDRPLKCEWLPSWSKVTPGQVVLGSL